MREYVSIGIVCLLMHTVVMPVLYQQESSEPVNEEDNEGSSRLESKGTRSLAQTPYLCSRVIFDILD